MLIAVCLYFSSTWMKYLRTCFPLSLRSSIAISLAVSSLMRYSIVCLLPVTCSSILGSRSKSSFSSASHSDNLLFTHVEKSVLTAKLLCKSFPYTTLIPFSVSYTGTNSFSIIFKSAIKNLLSVFTITPKGDIMTISTTSVC